MSNAEPDVAVSAPTCEICGREWSLDKNPEEWLGIEVDHAGRRLYAAFCSREHAQAWFAKPLPEPPPRTPPPPLDGGERALIIGVGALAVVAAVVFVVGLVEIFRVASNWF